MGLTVKELRAQLAQLPDEWPVVLAKDREGNALSPLERATRGAYQPTSTWSGLWSDDGRTENAVCLWPVS